VRTRPEPLDAVPDEGGYEEPEHGRRRKKRRKHRRRERESGGKPAWVYLVFAAGMFIGLGMIAGLFYLAHALELEFDLIVIAIKLAFMLPISCVILILSMVISSSISGGIDFGPAHWAILKAGGMLIFINLCYMIPIPYVGSALALPIWIMGLMFLFGLDFWECRLIILINWCLDTIVAIFLLSLLAALVRGGKIDAERFQPELARQKEAEKRLAAELKEEGEAESYFRKLGADLLFYDEDDPNEGRVRAVLCHNSRVEDADLAMVKKLKKVNSVTLDSRPITDAGIKHLEEAKTLTLIGLENTKVTDAGVKRLQQALPKAIINRGGGGGLKGPSP
jgi:hypothetical protein